MQPTILFILLAAVFDTCICNSSDARTSVNLSAFHNKPFTVQTDDVYSTFTSVHTVFHT